MHQVFTPPKTRRVSRPCSGAIYSHKLLAPYIVHLLLQYVLDHTNFSVTRHSMLVTSLGSVFSAGDGTDGALGLGGRESSDAFRLVEW